MGNAISSDPQNIIFLVFNLSTTFNNGYDLEFTQFNFDTKKAAQMRLFEIFLKTRLFYLRCNELPFQREKILEDNQTIQIFDVFLFQDTGDRDRPICVHDYKTT